MMSMPKFLPKPQTGGKHDQTMWAMSMLYDNFVVYKQHMFMWWSHKHSWTVFFKIPKGYEDVQGFTVTCDHVVALSKRDSAHVLWILSWEEIAQFFRKEEFHTPVPVKELHRFSLEGPLKELFWSPFEREGFLWGYITLAPKHKFRILLSKNYETGLFNRIDENLYDVNGEPWNFVQLDENRVEAMPSGSLKYVHNRLKDNRLKDNENDRSQTSWDVLLTRGNTVALQKPKERKISIYKWFPGNEYHELKFSVDLRPEEEVKDLVFSSNLVLYDSGQDAYVLVLPGPKDHSHERITLSKNYYGTTRLGIPILQDPTNPGRACFLPFGQFEDTGALYPNTKIGLQPYLVRQEYEPHADLHRLCYANETWNGTQFDVIS